MSSKRQAAGRQTQQWIQFTYSTNQIHFLITFQSSLHVEQIGIYIIKIETCRFHVHFKIDGCYILCLLLYILLGVVKVSCSYLYVDYLQGKV